MRNLKNSKWWYSAVIRALKTFCQTLIACIGTATVMSEVNWGVLFSSAILAMILSMLTSVAGLPEVDDIYIEEEEKEPDVYE